jgi:hypothetical protein
MLPERASGPLEEGEEGEREPPGVPVGEPLGAPPPARLTASRMIFAHMSSSPLALPRLELELRRGVPGRDMAITEGK